MLDWKNLSAGQRLVTSFVALFVAAFWLIPFLAAAQGKVAFDMASALAILGIAAGMLGIVLNPDAVHGRPAATSWRQTPAACKVLFIVAAAALLLLGALRALGS